MQNQNTRRGNTQNVNDDSHKKGCHSRVSLSGISTFFNNTQGADPRQKPSEMTGTKNRRHAELVSASSRYDNNKTLKQVQGDGIGGFTLIELLVVVLIIGILAAVALPQYKLAVAKSRLATIRPLLAAVKTAEETYYLANGEYTNNWAELDVDLTACENPYTDIKKCGDFWIDPLTNMSLTNIGAYYCPNESSWYNCMDKHEYKYLVWFNHSTKPNQIECIGETNLGIKVCNTLN